MAEHLCVMRGVVWSVGVCGWGKGGGGWGLGVGGKMQINVYHLLKDISLFLHRSSKQFHLLFVLRKHIIIVLYIK